MVEWASSGTGGKSLNEMSAINQVIQAIPTSVMRKELEAAEVQLPNSDALASLSTSFAEWLEELRYNLRLPPSHTYANLFSSVDEDVRFHTANPRACPILTHA